MLDFSDLPYQYFPPKRNALVAWVIGVFNRLNRLPKVLKVEGVEVSGVEALHRERRGRGRRRDRILFLPNHPTHADAAVFLEALRQSGFSSQMMAAYDVFLRGRMDAWVMQKLGAFSVDREGSDQRAMKEAAGILAKGKHALTIFPEGNVYLRNDRSPHSAMAPRSWRSVPPKNSAQSTASCPGGAGFDQTDACHRLPGKSGGVAG